MRARPPGRARCRIAYPPSEATETVDNDHYATRGTRELLKTLLRNIFPTFSAGSACRVRTHNRLIVTFLNPVLLLNFLFSCESLVRSQKSA